MRESSLLAHESVKPKKESHYKQIKKALGKIKKGTSYVIATHTPLSYHQVARRLKEMEDKKMVKVVGRDSTIKTRPLLWALNVGYENNY